jgi:hypothetical protein
MIPMHFVAPVNGIFKGSFVTAAVFVPFDTSTAMIEMQMGKHYIGYIVSVKPEIGQRLVQTGFAVQVIIAKKLIRLFVADSVVDQYQSVSILYQKTTHRPVAHVVFVSRIQFVPDTFGYHSEHRAAIEFKESCVYGV